MGKGGAGATSSALGIGGWFGAGDGLARSFHVAQFNSGL